MCKVITTYRVDTEVRKDLKKLTVNEEKDNVSDMLRFLIDFYKQSKENSHGEEIEEIIG